MEENNKPQETEKKTQNKKPATKKQTTKKTTTKSETAKKQTTKKTTAKTQTAKKQTAKKDTSKKDTSKKEVSKAKQTNEETQANVIPEPEQTMQKAEPVQTAETTQINQAVQQNEANQEASKFNVSKKQPIKKKRKKGPIVFLLILIVAIVAALGYYFLYYSTPEQVIKRTISSSMNSYKNDTKNTNYNTSKTNVSIDANITANTDYIDKDVIDLINKTEISFDVQSSKEDKQLIVNLESNYGKDPLINMQMFSDAKNEKTYIYLKDLLNKYIEIDEDNTYYEGLIELFEAQNGLESENDKAQKASNIVEKEILGIIKSEYCSSQKVDINVNNEKVNATKNTVKMNMAQFKKELSQIFNNLKNNQEYLNCFESSENIGGMLEEAIDSIDEIEEESSFTLEFSIYTKGFLQEPVKYEVKFYEQTSMQSIAISATEIGENEYYYEITMNDMLPIISGKMKIEERNDNEGTVKFMLNIQEIGTFELKIDYSEKYDEQIDKVDVKNSVKSDNLTLIDQINLANNLQNSKLFELIEDFSGTSLTEPLDPELNAPTSPIETDENEDNPTTIPENEEDEEVKTKDNEIISYNDKYKITFNVPTGYTSRFVSENYRSLDKSDGDVSVKVSTESGTKDDYYKDLETSAETYKKDDYKNVTLTNMETMEVEGRKVYYATLSYERESGNYTYKNSTKYVWTEISSDYLMDLRISNSDKMTDDELKQILTIKVENN